MTKFPSKFIKRIQEILPKDEWESFFTRATEPLPKTIRLASNFAPPKHWNLSPVAEIPEAFFIERNNQRELPLGHTLEHFCGKIYSASLSSLLAVQVLDPQPHEKILDVAASPGSKSTFIADRMQNTGVLVCNEPSSSRSSKLASNLDRMGIFNAVLLQSDGCLLNNFFDQEFDRILLDAPCSSEGFGRKNSRFFSKIWNEKKIFQAAKLQKRLILSSFEILRPGGIMVYSTCTSSPEENEAVVQFLVDTFGESVEILPIDLGKIPHHTGISKFSEQKFSPQIYKNVRRIWPHLHNSKWDSEIFFLAKIQKKHALSRSPVKKNFPLQALKIYGKNENARICSFLQKNFGIDTTKFKSKNLGEKNGQIFLITPESARFTTKNLYRRCGLHILSKLGLKNIKSPGFITSTFSIHFGSNATKNTLLLSEEEKNRWLSGYDIPLSDKKHQDGDLLLVQFNSFCLGYGKVQKNGTILKNKLDRNLVF